MNGWRQVLELNSARVPTAGSAADLRSAIGRGADLRIYTEFRHNEHIEPGSTNPEIVREVSDFRVAYLVDDRWVAGIMNLRMPIVPPAGFGPRASMSFFLYNEDGRQAIARPYLEGAIATGAPGPGMLDDHSDMPKYHQQDAWDTGTNAPSSNFIYDFEVFRYFVRDDWHEVLAHDAGGQVTGGSLDLLVEAFSAGAEIKVGISGLCSDLGGGPKHEVFVHGGPAYYSTQRKIFCAGSQPVVRVKPNIPMRYVSRGWDFGWLMPRTDGTVERWLCNPYTLKFAKSQSACSLRWFVR
ncbi:MAG: hypothetical protein IT423_18865 [Pirellulaceae bacterium]|nr:hypothetical protein [Pirellulaceae bacterium]